jgi:hypothetical protein
MKFFVTDPKNNKREIYPIFDDLTFKQVQIVGFNTYFITQYAKYIYEKAKENGIENPVITADIRVSLNGRPFYPLIDPNIDLSKVEYHWYQHADWILPHPDEQAKRQSLIQSRVSN